MASSKRPSKLRPFADTGIPSWVGRARKLTWITPVRGGVDAEEEAEKSANQINPHHLLQQILRVLPKHHLIQKLQITELDLEALLLR